MTMPPPPDHLELTFDGGLLKGRRPILAALHQRRPRLHDRLAEIPRRFADIDVCLLHLGGTRIAGVPLTMDADQGVRFLQLIRPRQTVPVHFDD